MSSVAMAGLMPGSEAIDANALLASRAVLARVSAVGSVMGRYTTKAPAAVQWAPDVSRVALTTLSGTAHGA